MLNYKQAGVDIEKADMLTEAIQKTVGSSNIGMFAGLYEHPFIPEYYLVGCCDGVGTKVIPLTERKQVKTAAIDLIAMNLNDMICTGARPMFFLDYFATNKLDVEVTSEFVAALKNELSKYQCTLLGGETAELSDLVSANHFDVGGFAVGIVKKENVLRKENVEENDVVIGLCSSGPHSNGYTLIRKLYEKNLLDEEEMNSALAPTFIYVNEILDLCDKKLIKVCANITGGGVEGNLNRVIPNGLCAEVFESAIPGNPLFDKLKQLVGRDEAFKTFNMGVGMCVVCSESNKQKVMQVCSKYNPFEFGVIKKDETGSNICLR
jgi:phosphoribosylformylglycinamidine cyclo-ligase